MNLKNISFSEFTDDQKSAIDSISEWYKNSSRQVFKMGGVAGTGKTTLIANLATLLKHTTGHYPTIAYCAFTGKASKVMRDKGMDANTIHSTIYIPEVSHNKETEMIEYSFVLKDSIDADLIVVDEASTVSQELCNDILSFNKKVLYVGDYAQLPPVGDDINLMEEKELDFKLEKIHRQAEKSGIIRLSMAIRNGDDVAYHETQDTVKVPISKFDKSELVYFNQVICGMNRVRVRTNRIMREAYGFKSEFPEKKDKMIFLTNDKEHNIYNGQQFIVVSSKKDKDGDFFLEYVDIYDKDAGVQRCIVTQKLINSEKGTSTLKLTKKEWKKKMNQCDYGYCITSYKSQGSEFNTVLMIDDGFGFWDDDLRRRHLYTCCTRAKQRFVWLNGIL